MRNQYTNLYKGSDFKLQISNVERESSKLNVQRSTMLKIAGWIIDDDAIDAWKKQAQVLGWQTAITTRQRVLETLRERKYKGLKPLPVTKEDFIFVPWPKMTKEARGKSVCILVRLKEDVNESWDNFTSIPAESNDDAIFSAFESDGLKLGEWVTVPDPFGADLPFYRRYPGVRCPPEPPLDPKGFKIRRVQ